MLFFGFPAYFTIIPELAHKILGKLSGEKLPIMAFAAKVSYSGNALKHMHKISSKK